MKLHIMRPEPSQDTSNMELPVQVKLYLEASDVTLQEIPVDIFGKKADQVKIDLQLHGETLPAFSKDSLASWRDTGGTLALKNFEVRSGDMDVGVTGEVALDMDMRPLGAFSAKIHGVDHMVGILAGQAEFQKPPGNVILEELRRMNRLEETGDKKVMNLALSLQNGLLFIGPIPIYELSPVVN